MSYSQAARMFIIEHHFPSNSFAASREAFSNKYPHKVASNKTVLHQLLTTFRATISVRLPQALPATKQPKLQPYQFQTVYQLQQRTMAATIQYGHRLSRCPVKAIMRSSYACILHGTFCIMAFMSITETLTFQPCLHPFVK
jgi:hypothetical protein